MEKQVSSREIFKGRVFRVEVDEILLPDGKPATREVVRHNGGVCVLPLDADDTVLFVRQFRYPFAREVLELPAGKLEPGEDPAACGLRELEEETGHQAGDYISLGHLYPTPAYTDELLHLYLARDLTATRQRLDPDEFLSVERIPFPKALELCVSGEITDSKTLVAIFRYNERYRKG